ncbi:MAG: hypothetical protein ACLR7U_03295 [Ruthenibacterium lactatiformans]
MGILQQPYFEDPRPFAVRFAVVMLLFYYIDAQHLPRVLALLEEVHSDEYYLKNGFAWAASMCYAISRRDAALAASRAAGRIYLPQDHPENL